MADSGIEALTEDLPAPDFETVAFTTPPPLSEATVAIVTTASLHHPDQDDFSPTDIGYRILDGSRRDYVTGHWSPNFDGAGFAYDMNTVFPLDRLDELAARGVIGRVADQHLAYAGNQFESTAPPRGLWCDFPLGRPLGKPGDAEFQHQVLAAAFALLDATEPVLAEFDEAITDDGAEMLACPLPPHHDPDAHPAVDEARGLRAAYDRGVVQSGGRFGAGRVVGADDIPAAIESFIRIAAGTAWKEAGVPGLPMRVAHDIRSYYETAALAMVDHAPPAWAGTRWFYDQTEAGKVMLAARTAMREQGAPQPMWFYLTPGDR